MKQFIIIGLLSILPIGVKSQFYVNNVAPQNVKYLSIKTPHYTFIYPDSFRYAQQLANYAETLRPHITKTIPVLKPPQTFPIVLYPNTSLSNGTAAYAPRRLELQAVSSHATQQQPWYKQLLIHELRHTAQLNYVRENTSWIYRALLGESITGTAYAVPRWFLEGDAVATETALTNSGRGRYAPFSESLRAILVENGKNYSYPKMMLTNSLKDYTPSYYTSGYYFTAMARYFTQTSIPTTRMIDYGIRFPFQFTDGVRRVTDKQTLQFYRHAFSHLTKEFQKEDRERTISPTQPVTPYNTKDFINYGQLWQANADTIVAVRTGFDMPAKFVFINATTGKEEIFYAPGTLTEGQVSLNEDETKNTIVWSESVPDIRWASRIRTVINQYNCATRKRKKFYPEFKAYSPVKKGNRIVVAEAAPTGDNYLSVYSEAGKKLSYIPFPFNHYATNPTWKNDTEISFVYVTPKGSCIAEWSINSRKIREIMPYGNDNIIYFQLRRGKYYYIAADKSINNIYAYDTATNRTTLIVKPRFGTRFFAFRGDSLLFNDYTTKGYKIAIAPVEHQPVIKDSTPDFNTLLTQSLAKAEGEIAPENMTIDTIYPVKKYHRAANLFNFNSWSPLYTNPYAYSTRLGASVFTQNVLGTLTGSLGYYYDPTSDYKNGVELSFDYNRFFVGLNSTTSYSWVKDEPDTRGVVIDANRWQTNNSLYAPLNMSRGNTRMYLVPQVGLSYARQNIFHYHPFTGNLIGEAHPEQYGVIGEARLTMSSIPVARTLLNRKQLSVLAGAVPNIDDGGGMGYARLRLNVPGFFKHDVLQLAAGGQGNSSIFSDRIPIARGYEKPLKYISGTSSSKSYELYRRTGDYYTISADYVFSLGYPDWNVGNVFFIKQFYAGLFADYTKYSGDYIFAVKSNGLNRAGTSGIPQDIQPLLDETTAGMTSVGASLRSQFITWFNVSTYSLGVQAAYRLNEKDVVYNLLFSFTIN